MQGQGNLEINGVVYWAKNLFLRRCLCSEVDGLKLLMYYNITYFLGSYLGCGGRSSVAIAALDPAGSREKNRRKNIFIMNQFRLKSV